jgi:hypothetical protein
MGAPAATQLPCLTAPTDGSALKDSDVAGLSLEAGGGLFGPTDSQRTTRSRSRVE